MAASQTNAPVWPSLGAVAAGGAAVAVAAAPPPAVAPAAQHSGVATRRLLSSRQASARGEAGLASASVGSSSPKQAAEPRVPGQAESSFTSAKGPPVILKHEIVLASSMLEDEDLKAEDLGSILENMQQENEAAAAGAAAGLGVATAPGSSNPQAPAPAAAALSGAFLSPTKAGIQSQSVRSSPVRPFKLDAPI